MATSPQPSGWTSVGPAPKSTCAASPGSNSSRLVVSGGSWPRHATRDAWQRVSDAGERATPGDSDRDGK